jgi:putative membrane protein
MRRVRWMMFVVLMSAPAQSFAQASNAKSPGSNKTAPQGSENKPQSKSREGDTAGQQEPALSESQVLAKLHAANLMEMEAGGLAASRAQSNKVKQYGEQLIKDHRQADDTVAAFAKRKGVDLANEPAKKSEENADTAHDAHAMGANMDQLRTLKGSEFDRAFLAAMIGDHDDALRMVRNARSQTHDSEFRALLSKLQPVLQQHGL